MSKELARKVLKVIEGRPSTNMELAEQFMVTTPRMRRITDKLREQGLIVGKKIQGERNWVYLYRKA